MVVKAVAIDITRLFYVTIWSLQASILREGSRQMAEIARSEAGWSTFVQSQKSG